jgi:thiamine-monophosphate kinase
MADRGLDEFALIARHFAPLSRGAPGAFNLTDDVAEISVASQGLLVSCDSMIEGVHFLPDDPIEAVARKLLRRNVSDIVAKGARPTGYLLALLWPRRRSTEEIGAFASGLEEDQAIYGISLLGGDTSSTDGPLSATITIFGEPLGRGPVRRAGAGAGDCVFITGTIGDAGLGLASARGLLPGLPDADASWLVGRYRLPQPRSNAARLIAERATASIDVSDGLVADAGHLARTSGVRLEIDAARVPVSPAAGRWLALQPDQEAARMALFSAGDDYEALFTAPRAVAAQVIEAAGQLNVPLSLIGICVEGGGVGFRSNDGRILATGTGGWRHF